MTMPENETIGFVKCRIRYATEDFENVRIP
jgi:hypothetical protein